MTNTNTQKAQGSGAGEALSAASGMLIRHHQWHMQQRTPDPEHGFIPADEYGDSTLYEDTAEAIDKIDRAIAALSQPPEASEGWRPEPIPDDCLRAVIGELGNQIHNLGCEHQNDERLSGRLGELRNEAWNIARKASEASEGEAVREAAAKVAEGYYNLNAARVKASQGADDVSADAAYVAGCIATEIRAMPLPKPSPMQELPGEERDQLYGLIDGLGLTEDQEMMFRSRVRCNLAIQAAITPKPEASALREALELLARVKSETFGGPVGGGDGNTFIVRTLTGKTLNDITALLALAQPAPEQGE